MEMVCPECNKLQAKSYKCNYCGGQITNLGRAQEVFQDDYTANMPINDALNYCIHVFKCENCGNSENIPVNKIFI